MSAWPQVLRTENGPKLLVEAFVRLTEASKVSLRYIQPDKPDQNVYVERFNRAFHDQILDRHLFV